MAERSGLYIVLMVALVGVIGITILSVQSHDYSGTDIDADMIGGAMTGTDYAALGITGRVTDNGTTSDLCSDSDGGSDHYIKGTVIGGGVSFSQNDYCLILIQNGQIDSTSCNSTDPNCRLHEFYCQDGTRRGERIQCDYGCSNGACLSAPVKSSGPICTDSDGGYDRYTYGEILVTGGPSNQVPTGKDRCYLLNSGPVTSCSGSLCTMEEYSCKDYDGDGIKESYGSGVENAPCPNGCSNGACSKTVTYVPFLIGIGDTSPASDVVIATDVSQKLMSKGLIDTSSNTAVGLAKLFSEIDAMQLDNRVTLVIYNGAAIIVVGAHSPATHVTYAAEVSSILYAKGITAKTILSSSITSSDLKNLFIIPCSDSDGGKIYNVRGSVTGYTNTNQRYSYEDSCSTDLTTLSEYYCTDVGNFYSVTTVSCPYTCYNGVCLASKPMVDTGDSTPRVAYWYGKVNQHTENGVWKTDPDGVSGANLDMLAYCKKWYPNTVSFESYKLETFSGWREAGNNGNYTSTKQSYKCVGGKANIPCTDNDNTPDVTNTWIGPSNMANYPSLYVKGTGRGVYSGGDGTPMIFGAEPNPNSVTPSPYSYSVFYDYCSTYDPTNLIEAFCTSDGNLSSIGVTCQYGCSNGACIKLPSVLNSTPVLDSTCFDTDGSKEMYVKGLVYNKDHSAVDSSSIIEDSYSENDELSAEVLSSSTARLKVFGEQKAVSLSETVKFFVGTFRITDIEFYGLGDSRNKVEYDLLDVNDFCVGQELNEIYCTSGGPQMDEIMCQYGCSNGACIKSPPVLPPALNGTCFDTDGGKNYYVRGTVTNPPPQYVGGWTDTCLDNITLQEGSCVAGLGVHTYNCPSGCSNGACSKGLNITSNLTVYSYTEKCGDGIVGMYEDCDGDDIRSKGYLEFTLTKSTTGQGVTITMDGKEYTIVMLGANLDSKSVILSVNGQKTSITLSEDKFVGGLYLYIKSISVPTNVEDAYVTIIAKGNKIEECVGLKYGNYNFDDGDLSCTADCKYDLSGCTGSVPSFCSTNNVYLVEDDVYTLTSSGVDYTFDVKNIAYNGMGDTDTDVVFGIETGGQSYTYTLSVGEQKTVNGLAFYVKDIFIDNVNTGGSDTVEVCFDKQSVSSGSLDFNDFHQVIITRDSLANTVFIVGRQASMEDVIGMSDIVARLQRYVAGNPFPVSIVKFDDEVTDNMLYNSNIIVVGGMCANTATAKLYGYQKGNSESCASKDTPGVGRIKIIRNKDTDKLILLVHGYSAEDTALAARVLAMWDNYEDLLENADSICVSGNPNDMNVRSC